MNNDKLRMKEKKQVNPDEKLLLFFFFSRIIIITKLGREMNKIEK